MAWARLLGSSSKDTLSESTELLLGSLAGDDPSLPPLSSRLAEIPTLSAAGLSAVFAADSRAPVRLALASAPRLPRADRRALVEWAASSPDHLYPVTRAISSLPFRLAVEMYEMIELPDGRPSYAASHLVDQLYRRPARSSERFEELMLLADRLEDGHLAAEALRWATRSKSAQEIESLLPRLSPRQALDVFCALFSRMDYKLTAPRARRVVALLEACEGEHQRLQSVALDDFFDLRPSATPAAVEILVRSQQPLLLRLAVNSVGELSPALLAQLVVAYPLENLFELVNHVSDLPQLWEPFCARASELDTREDRSAREYLFQDALRKVSQDSDDPPSPELVNALSSLTLGLLTSAREHFWFDSTAVTYLLTGDLAPESWWREVDPTPEEMSRLLQMALELYLHEPEYPKALPPSFEERMWKVPGLLPLLGDGLLENPGRSAGRPSFQRFLLDRLQLFLVDRLGEDSHAWEVALSLASEFEGSAEALVGTAKALS